MNSQIGGVGGCDPMRRPPRPPRSDLGVPVAFGYVRVRPDGPAASGGEQLLALEAFASRCGWVLDEAFVDDEPARPLVAFRHLRVATLAAIRELREPVAVMVMSWQDLGNARSEAAAVRTDFERTTGVPVVIGPTLRPPLGTPGAAEAPPAEQRRSPQPRSTDPMWTELVRAPEPSRGACEPAARRAR